MTSKARAALLVLLLGACGDAATSAPANPDTPASASEELVGTWESEDDGGAEHFVLTMTPDGGFSLAVSKGGVRAEAEGSWSLDRVEGNTYFIEVDTTKGGGKVRLVLHDDHLEYFRQDNPDVSLRFVRGR